MTSETLTSTPTSPPESPTRLRASDAEREDTVAQLHQALGEGRLDLADNESRVAAGVPQGLPSAEQDRTFGSGTGGSPAGA